MIFRLLGWGLFEGGIYTFPCKDVEDKVKMVNLFQWQVSKPPEIGSQRLDFILYLSTEKGNSSWIASIQQYTQQNLWIAMSVELLAWKKLKG